MPKTKVKAVVIPEVPALLLPNYVDAAGSTSHHQNYHSLSHCLRTNIFPGAPSTWKSLTSDSYISHPLTNWPADPYPWYGHKTDEVVQWTERNIMNQKLNKLLTHMENKGTAK
ncbi:ciliary microtubule inner protein 4 [Odontesthes bonariensis]|uniref:ciliary microtubule inner protein 4 n=1 Tax=Odontesthes bonariensis TaxID=219752 RepID=UPI003F584B1F